MRDARMKIATPLLDLFGLLLTVARIRSKMGSTYEGCSKMVVSIAYINYSYNGYVNIILKL